MATERERSETDEVADLAHALARTARRKKSLGVKPRKRSAAAPPPEAQPAPATPRISPSAARAAELAEAAHATSAARAGSETRLRLVENSQPPAQSARDVQEQAAGAQTLDELRARVSVCQACSLCKTRTQTVFMDGAAERGILFVGEAPGADEDRTGVPFVGRSGQLLTDIITKGMGIPRQEVAIANVLKCRPPDNRDPTPAEKTICTPWLDRQIALIDPKVIIPLGRHAANHVLGTQDAAMGALRQKVHERGGRKIVPTFHPSYLLRSPGEKKECWKDIQLAMGILGIEPKKPL